jgi:hypothetical protein
LGTLTRFTDPSRTSPGIQAPRRSLAAVWRAKTPEYRRPKVDCRRHNPCNARNRV